MRAAMIPGTHPHKVRMKVIRKDPHPLSATAKGGNIMAKITLMQDMIFKL